MMIANPIPFAKLEGLGNDFVLIDGRGEVPAVTPELARALADRRLGVGCDQILVLEPPRTTGALCSYRIWNADGSAAEQCGNGARCIGRWLHLNGELEQAALLDSPAGPIHLRLTDDDRVETTLSVPNFRPEAIGRDLAGPPPWPLDIDGRRLECYGASLGNPHVLVLQEDIPSPVADAEHTADRHLAALGASIGRHPAFPRGVNVGLGRIVDAHTLHLQVHERGAGPTPACGSGASAAAAMLIDAGKMHNPVTVIQPGGRLVIEWPGAGQAIRMTGPARFVFAGTFNWNTQ